MEEKFKEKRNFVDNVAYKNKFQFRIWVNDFMICQRYFKINGFNDDSIYTAEFTDCMNGIVKSIQDDMISKSRVWMWYTDMSQPMKSNGFMTEEELETYGANWLHVLADDNIVGNIVLPDGKILYKEYVDFSETDKNFNNDTERPADGDVVFKFSFLIDDTPVFEKIWEGNNYPKFVRNSVDLANNYNGVTNEEIASFSFNYAIVRHLQQGKSNLISDFIRRICGTLSNSFTEKYDYTKEMDVFKNNPEIDKEQFEKAVAIYGVISPEVVGHIDIPTEERNYDYYSALESYKRSWKKATAKKTREYNSTLYENMSQRQIDYINSHY